MTVLERDTQGLDGWWLCSLHGRQGIVPGNRLKILVGMYDKKPAGPGPGPPATPPQPQPSLPQGVHAPMPPASQYSPMLPTAYQSQPDNVYLVPTPSKAQQGLYQAPGTNPQFQSPPAKQTSTFSKQTPHHSFPSPATDLYQVPPGPGSPAQDIYQVPPSAGIGNDIYQVPPSLDTRSWEGTKPPAKVRPTWHSCETTWGYLGPGCHSTHRPASLCIWFEAKERGVWINVSIYLIQVRCISDIELVMEVFSSLP